MNNTYKTVSAAINTGFKKIFALPNIIANKYKANKSGERKGKEMDTYFVHDDRIDNSLLRTDTQRRFVRDIEE